MSSVTEPNVDQDPPAGRRAERIPAARRREQILDAAARVFGERGYAGATTDQVAQVAGISQPYVVRMFGSKEKLFGEVLDRARERLEQLFLEAVRTADERGLTGDARREFFGQGYMDLLEEGGIVLPLMQGFLLGHDPVLGPKARHGFLRIYRILRDQGGLGADDAREFLARGMLLNTLLTLQMTSLHDDDDAARELLDCAFGAKLGVVMGLAKDAL